NNVFKPLFLCSSGLLIYISTGSFIGNSFIWLNEAEQNRFRVVSNKKETMFKLSSGTQEDYGWRLQVLYFLRALLAFFAQIEHQLGAWEIFDSYIVQPTVYRDIVYVFIGLLGLQWSKALLMNACITPFNVPVQPDGLAAIYNMIKKKPTWISQPGNKDVQQDVPPDGAAGLGVGVEPCGQQTDDADMKYDNKSGGAVV
ncbi:hypothetical protein RFI_23183, partial [Reticulomyxa filosa]